MPPHIKAKTLFEVLVQMCVSVCVCVQQHVYCMVLIFCFAFTSPYLLCFTSSSCHVYCQKSQSRASEHNTLASCRRSDLIFKLTSKHININVIQFSLELCSSLQIKIQYSHCSFEVWSFCVLLTNWSSMLAVELQIWGGR